MGYHHFFRPVRCGTQNQKISIFKSACKQRDTLRVWGAKSHQKSSFFNTPLPASAFFNTKEVLSRFSKNRGPGKWPKKGPKKKSCSKKTFQGPFFTFLEKIRQNFEKITKIWIFRTGQKRPGIRHAPPGRVRAYNAKTPPNFSPPPCHIKFQI